MNKKKLTMADFNEEIHTDGFILIFVIGLFGAQSS
jgi:hypothetical protein